MIPINLGNVTVRYLEVQDHAAYIAMERDAEIKQYVGGPSKREEQDLLSSLHEYSPCTSLLVVADSETNTFVGRCGLLEKRGSSEVELYILLTQTHRRKGIASVVVPFLMEIILILGTKLVIYVMFSQVLNRHRMATILVFIGLIVTVLPIPLLSGVKSTLGFFENLENALVQVWPATKNPIFDDVSLGREDMTAQIISYPHPSGKELLIEFPHTMSLDEVRIVLLAGDAEEGGRLRADLPKAKHLRFREWVTNRLALAIPYRYFLLCGLVLGFAGAFLILFGHRHVAPSPDDAT